MSAALKDMLTSVADEEHARFDARGPAADTQAYVRVIRPRRAARRAGLAATALAGVGLAGVGYLALGSTPDGVGPAVDTPTATASAPGPGPAAIAGEPGWSVGGIVIDPAASAVSVAEAAGPVVGASVACTALDAFGDLDGGDGWAAGAGRDLGAFVDPSGAATEVHLKSFDQAADADAYLRDLESVAASCAADLDGAGIRVGTSSAALTGLPGELVEVVIPGDDPAWELTVHIDGTDAIGIVTTPDARVGALAVIADWVERGAAPAEGDEGAAG